MHNLLPPVAGLPHVNLEESKRKSTNFFGAWAGSKGLRGRSLCVAASGVGAWRMPANTHVQRAMTKAKLTAKGFVIF